jgi:hypothetical protein
MVNFHTSSCINQSRDGDSQGFARAWLLPFSFIRLWKDDILHTRTSMSARVGQAGLSGLSGLFCLTG